MSGLDKPVVRRRITWQTMVAVASVLMLLFAACTSGSSTSDVGSDIIEARALTDADVQAALKTLHRNTMTPE